MGVDRDRRDTAPADGFDLKLCQGTLLGAAGYLFWSGANPALPGGLLTVAVVTWLRQLPDRMVTPPAPRPGPARPWIAMTCLSCSGVRPYCCALAASWLSAS